MNNLNEKTKKFLRVNPARFQIMMVLIPKPRHGYEIIQEIKHITGKKLAIATTYRNLENMQKAGLVEVTDPPTSAGKVDPRRIYYKLTALGEDVFNAERELRKKELAYSDAAKPPKKLIPGLL